MSSESSTLPYFHLHHVMEWFSCQRKAASYVNGNAHSVHYSAVLRERCRVFDSYAKRQRATSVEQISMATDEIDASHRMSLKHLQARPQSGKVFVGICLTYKGAVISIPEMWWNARTKTWNAEFCTASTSLRKDTSITIAFCSYVLQKLQLPIPQFFLSCYRDAGDASKLNWKSFGISTKIEKRLEEYNEKFDALIRALPLTEHNLDTFEPCNKQYCEYCSLQTKIPIDAVVTLRKSKDLVEELKSQDIKFFKDIPATYKLTTMQKRQIAAVKEKSVIVVEKELQDYLQKLEYPRYYLDFEAYNMAISNISDYKNWDFIPFLFSLQWQNEPKGSIKSFLWAMQPGYDKREDMWKQLCAHLAKAGSIIVFGKEFEAHILASLGEAFNQTHESEIMLEKLSDLQDPFSQLSIYHPEQRGKIALKILSHIWFDDDSAYKIKEGIEANYYYLKLTDEVNMVFEDTYKYPYYGEILREIDQHSPKRVALRDIANYCKRDTEIMIRLIQMIESKLNVY